jgi:hypothetical protein
MAEQLGMDPANARWQRARLAGHSSVLLELAGEVQRTGHASHNPLLAALVPGTMILTAGSIFLAQNAANDIRQAAAAAEELLGRLGVNIDEQVAASSATEGYLDGLISQSQANALFDEVMENPDALDGMTPQQVQAWWNRLSPEQQDQFVTEQHWVAGNTNGVPFDRRIEANALSAQEMLDDRGSMTPEQAAYLAEVAEGERNLISFDPAADRIVEMIGELGPDTQNIVNFVPGTTAAIDDFYNLETQQMGEELAARADPPGSTVVFVYKDSPWPTFDEFGVYHSAWAASTGDPYHNFNTALGFENPTNIPVTSIEHSFASAVGGYAEIQGTQFDTRIVLGGIGMSDGWEPNPGTDYYSFTGESDIIRLGRERYSEDLGTGYPHPPTQESGFIEMETEFEYTPPNPYVIGLPDLPPGPVDQHRIVGGVEDNQYVIDGILGIL